MMQLTHSVVEIPLVELPEGISFAGESWTRNWSYGKWNYADYAITHVLEDGTEHRYKLPRAIGEIIERQFEQGANDARAEMRRAMGL